MRQNKGDGRHLLKESREARYHLCLPFWSPMHLSTLPSSFLAISTLSSSSNTCRKQQQRLSIVRPPASLLLQCKQRQLLLALLPIPALAARVGCGPRKHQQDRKQKSERTKTSSSSNNRCNNRSSNRSRSSSNGHQELFG